MYIVLMFSLLKESSHHDYFFYPQEDLSSFLPFRRRHPTFARTINFRNEIVDPWAKEAAKSVVYAVGKPLLNEASLAYVSWSIPEAKIRDTAKWVGAHVKKERRYKPREAGGYASSYGAGEGLGQLALPVPIGPCSDLILPKGEGPQPRHVLVLLVR